MNERNQNCCLMTTTLDEETGKYVLTYIPLGINIDIVEFFLENSTCNNNHAISFDLEETGDEFWANMWKELEGSCE